MKGTALPKIQRWDLMSCGYFFCCCWIQHNKFHIILLIWEWKVERYCSTQNSTLGLHLQSTVYLYLKILLHLDRDVHVSIRCFSLKKLSSHSKGNKYFTGMVPFFGGKCTTILKWILELKPIFFNNESIVTNK